MATIARALPARRVTYNSRVKEAVTLLLHALLVVSVVAAMRRVDAGDRNAILSPLAVAGLLLGYVLARTRAVDMIAHSIALWPGCSPIALPGSSTGADGSCLVLWFRR